MKTVFLRFLSRFFPIAVFLSFFFYPGFPAPPAGKETTGIVRQEVNLNGLWETAVSKDPSYPPRVDRWQPAHVPVLTYGNAIAGTRWVWYRKDVVVPASFRGMKVDLLLSGARFNASVWCDGRFVGSRLDGYTPFSVDLTGRARPGATVRLEIRCQDWSAVFKDNYRLPVDADPDGERLRGVPPGKIIAPIGGHFYFYGIWDDVMLIARPQTFCDDVAIETSVRKNNTLTVRGTAAGGKGKLWIEGEVFDEGKTVLALPGRETDADGRFTLTAAFPKVRYWSPEDPHRYTLALVLRDRADGAVHDRYEERFGFRELWAEGHDLYLNGVKRHLLASSGWPQTKYQPPEEIRRAVADIKESNAVAFRLHTQPWQRRWLEEADDLGLMIVEEGALWCDGGGGYAYEDARFWENVHNHLAGMVRRDRNHPSLVMWSIENELLHCGALEKCSCVEERLAEAGRRVKELDPTHLITFEADHDPGGAADVIGLHYPREMPENVDYPNTCDWLGGSVKTGTAGGTAGSWNKDFFWDRRKPLYIGEYLWVFRQDYSPGSVFYGDEAYRDREEYRVKAKADAWLFQTVAYRRAGVSGMCPWTIADEGGRVDKKSPLYAAQKRAYEPVAIFPREYDTRFFTGDKVERSFDVFNDSPRSLTCEVRFSLGGRGVGKTDRFTLDPAGRRVSAVTIPFPAKSVPGGIVFRAELAAAGRSVSVFETRYRTFDRTVPAVPPGRTLLIYDPAGAWPAGRRMKGAAVLQNLSELAARNPADDILVIGPHAFIDGDMQGAAPVIGRRDSNADSFRRFLVEGGRVLILEQNTFAAVIPELELVEHASTLAFPVTEGHPLLKGLGPDDLKFWRGDHYVSRKEIRRPERYGAAAAAVSGGVDCLDQAPIVILSRGRGLAVFCQALVGAKFDTEPAARTLVANALAFLAAHRPPAGAALAVIGEPGGTSFRRRLDDLGLDYTEAGKVPDKIDLNRVSLLVLHGGGKTIESLATRMATHERPLTVFWHAPEKGSFEKLKAVLGLDAMTIIEAAGAVTLLDTAGSEFSGLLREDVAFLKPFGPDNWYRVVTPDTTVIDRALEPVGAAADSEAVPLEGWALSGQLVRKNDDRSIAFYTNGSATGEIVVAREGLYRLAFDAWGTPASGGWPMVTVKAEGRLIACLSISSRNERSWSCLARLPRGRVRIEFVYENDLFQNGEDRNLFLRTLHVSRAPVDTGNARLLSLPPALVSAGSKSRLRVLIDCVRWDVNTDNRTRGGRYAAALLAGLGASFRSGHPATEWIGPSFFEPAGRIAVFSRNDGRLNFGSNGAAKADFFCASAGSYTVIIKGFSTPAQGTFGKARITVDGKMVGELELNSTSSSEFPVGSIHLAAGSHELIVEFTNDLWLGAGKEDRNLFVNAVGFVVEG